MPKLKKYIFTIFSLLILCFLIGIFLPNKTLAAESDPNSDYDLAADSISVAPSIPTVNQKCIITVKIKNSSKKNLFTSAGLNFSYTFENFAITKTTETTPTIENYIKPGEYLTYTYEGKFISAAEKQLVFNIDVNNELKESDEGNNSMSKKVNVYLTSEADITASSVSLSTDKVIMGSPVDITATVKNNGKTSLTSATGFSTADIATSFPYFDYELKDVSYNDYPTLDSPLEPDKTFSYKYSGVFNNKGTFKLIFTIDKDNQLVEASESNNSTSTTITVYSSLKEVDDFLFLSKKVVFASSTTATISWTTSKNTTGVLNYGERQDNVFANQVESNTNSTSHSITINNLKPDTFYHYIIKATNGASEKSENISSFTTPADNMLRIISEPSLSVDSENKSAQVSWTTNLTSSGYVYYKKKGVSSYSLTGSDSFNAEHQITLNSLEIGQYDYYLVSTSTPGTFVKTNLVSFEISQAPITTTPASNQNEQGTVQNKNANTAGSILTVANKSLYSKLKGKIILKVESKGEAYYVNAKKETLHFLGRPEDAFRVIREQGTGIINDNLAKIPVGLSNLSGADSDNDGLPDAFEQAIGTDKNKADTDGDNYNDKDELITGYSPIVANKKLSDDKIFAASLSGRILLQVQGKGEAWYVNPGDGKRYFLSRPADAFNVMRKLGLGITNKDFKSLSK